MKLIQRYFLGQALTPLLVCVGGLSILALLTQSLSTIDLIVENRQSAFTFFYITVLALPQLIGIILPLAIFIAALYALNRLNVDSEMVVAKAGGLSPWGIASPLLRLATYALIIHLIINIFIQPLSFRNMREALLGVRADVASQMVRPGEFVKPASGLTLFTSEVGTDGIMSDVMIFDARDLDAPVTHMAKSGYLSKTTGNAALILVDGNTQSLDNLGQIQITAFRKAPFDLSEVMALDPVLRLKTSDRFLHELFFPDARDFANRKYRQELTAEGHARLATPLYNLALVLVALAFLARGQMQRMGYSKRIAVAAATGFIIRLIGFALESAGEDTPSLNIMQYALPLTVMVICLWYLLNKRRAQSWRKMLRPMPKTVRS